MTEKGNIHFHFHFGRLYPDDSSSSSSSSSDDGFPFPATTKQAQTKPPPQVRLVADYSDASEDDNDNDSVAQGAKEGGIPSASPPTVTGNPDDLDSPNDDHNKDIVTVGGTEPEKLVENPTPPCHLLTRLLDYSSSSSDDSQDENTDETASLTVQSSVGEEVNCEKDTKLEGSAVAGVSVMNNQQAIKPKQEKKDTKMDVNSERDNEAFDDNSDSDVTITGEVSRHSKIEASKMVTLSSDSESEKLATSDSSNSDDENLEPQKKKRRRIYCSFSSSSSEEEAKLSPLPDFRNDEKASMYNLRKIPKVKPKLPQFDEFISFPVPTPQPELELFSFDKAQLIQYLSDVKQQDCPTSWRFDTSKLSGEKTLKSATEFLQPLIKKFGFRLERLVWVDSPLSATKEFGCTRDLTRLLFNQRNAPNLKEISLSNVTTDLTSELLMRIVSADVDFRKRRSHLTTFKISSMFDKQTFDDLQMKLLSASQVPWKELQIRDCVLDSSDWDPFFHLLGGKKNCELQELRGLKFFDFQGGCKISQVESSVLPVNLVVSISSQDELEHLGIRVQFSEKESDNDKFIEDIKNSRQTELTSNVIPRNCHINSKNKLTIKCLGSLRKLKSLVLGREVELEYHYQQRQVPFSFVKRLETFHCASQWHHTLRFPLEGPRANTYVSSVTSLQLPDCLRDPSCIPKIARFFSNVTKLTMNLPSVAVLRSFFHHFSTSKLEELTLRTQFDFDFVLDSVLFPNSQQPLSEKTKKKIDSLKAYKYFEAFIEHFCVELPEDNSNQLTTMEGIGDLRSLKKLHLQHIPRILRIPQPHETKLWDEETCVVSCPSTSYPPYFISKKTYNLLFELPLHLNLEDIEVSAN